MRIFFLILFLILFSCKGKKNGNYEPQYDDHFYGSHFLIEEHKNYTRLKIINPWQKAQNIEFSYILAFSPDSIPDSLANFPVIKVPVRNVVSLSTTHIGFISALGEAGSITGISGAALVTDSLVKNAINEKRCFDIGYFPNIDYERILFLKPDVVFLYGLDGSIQNFIYRLNKVGIPSVLIAEYLENHPLGKAEWIKFFASFYNCINKGDSIFKEVQKNYFALKDSVRVVTNKPLVLAGLPWKDTWFVPGGRSFSARFIQDAGGDYLWKDDISNEYIALDLESVFLKALKADVWINTGSAQSIAQIAGIDERFSIIKAFRSDSVFNNDARAVAGGGNPYWESGVVHPDLILRDLIQIFHPLILSAKDLNYYRKLD